MNLLFVGLDGALRRRLVTALESLEPQVTSLPVPRRAQAPPPGADLAILAAFPEASAWIRHASSRANDGTPIVVALEPGQGAPIMRRELLEAGASDVIPTELDNFEIALRVRRLVDQRRLTRSLADQAALLETLLGLQREILSSPPESLYDSVLRAAVRTVPGAEAGSVLVREGDFFRFRASVGFHSGLENVVLAAEDMRRWHGGAAEEWQRAEPRILSRTGDRLEQSASATAGQQELAAAGRIDEIQANLYQPVVYHGDILAVLNLDNFHDPGAFTDASLVRARLFATPVAALLHEAHNRMLLAEAARTDPLTGLPNRRAFDQALEQELARARRHGLPFSVLLMDLQNFKRVNDVAGHAAGDRVLLKVAEAVSGALRQVDSVARWGGDEITTLLPHADGLAARDAARRYARVIIEATRGPLAVGVNVGCATFPEDGASADELMRVADERMYAAKAAGKVVID